MPIGVRRANKNSAIAVDLCTRIGLLLRFLYNFLDNQRLIFNSLILNGFFCAQFFGKGPENLELTRLGRFFVR